MTRTPEHRDRTDGTRPAAPRRRLVVGAIASSCALTVLWPLRATSIARSVLTEPGSLAREVDPLDLAGALAGYVAIAITAYLLLVCVANLLLSARLGGRPRSEPPLRRGRSRLVPVARLVASLTPKFLAVASTGVLVGAAPVGAAVPPSTPPPVMELVDGEGTASTDQQPHTSLPWADVTPPSPPASAGPGGREAEPSPAARVPAGSSPSAPRPSELSGASAADREHLVQPGEHLWGIAAATLLRRTPDAGPPSAHVVATYWLRLIAANRERLVDPDDPDLIHPGQRLVLP